MLASINYFLTYSIFIPAACLCMIPVRKYLRWQMPFKKFMVCTAAVILVICGVLCQLPVEHTSQLDMIFYIGMDICAVFYCISFRIKKTVLVYVFTFIVCMLAFATLFSYYWDAFRYPDANNDLMNTEIVLSQWIAAALISLLFVMLFWHRIEWLIHNYKDSRVWLLMSIPSLIISSCILNMQPQNYSNLYVERNFLISVFTSMTLLFLFLMTHMVFYFLTRTAHERVSAEQTKQLLELELRQYAIEKNYIEETHRLRHDFNHSVVTLSILLQEGNIQEAIHYLDNYSHHLSSRPALTDFCALPALNALLNEYYRRAKEAAIHFQYQIDLPAQLSIDEPQLCVLVGSLLNNAIEACKKIPTEKRCIKLLFDMEGESQLYLIIQNSYDGKIQWHNPKPSELPKGHYGISSVRTITEEHHGVARFYSEDTTFNAEIMLTVDGAPNNPPIPF